MTMTMKNNQFKIYNQVQYIQKSIHGGEKFFNLMDEFILKNFSLFTTELLRHVQNKQTVVLTGQFGLHLKSQIDFESFILFNGGIRKGAKLEIIACSNTVYPNYVFIDDSYYSGRTCKTIDTFLNTQGLNLDKILVVYDGSILKQKNVISLFRYHDHFNFR